MSITDPGDLSDTDPNSPIYVVQPIIGEEFTNPAYTLTTSLATAMEIDTGQYSILTVQIKPDGEALVDFDVSFRNHDSGEYEVFYSTATDWTIPDGVIMLDTNGEDPTSLADATVCSFRMDVSGHSSVKLRADGAAGTGTLNIFVRGE